MQPGGATSILGRVVSALFTLVAVTILAFCLIQFSGDSVSDELDGFGRMSSESLEKLRSLYRLDQPLPSQYLAWLADLARGDLGSSFEDRRPVAEKILERIGLTFTLNALSLLVMILIALPLGAWSALHPHSWLDRLSASGSYLLYALPVFWVALLLQMLFSARLGWLPIAGLQSEGAEQLGWLARGFDQLWHLLLPVVCLSYGGVAYLARFVRSNMLEELGADTLRAIRAKGIGTWSLLFRHGLARAGVPLLTLAGFVLPGLIGGSVIVERIFGLPGLGQLFLSAALSRDVPVVMGLTLLSAVATLAGIVLADLSYRFVDPRMRRHG